MSRCVQDIQANFCPHLSNERISREGGISIIRSYILRQQHLCSDQEGAWVEAA